MIRENLWDSSARRVRPHQTAYSIGKRVNEGRTHRACVPAKWNAIRKIKQGVLLLPPSGRHAGRYATQGVCSHPARTPNYSLLTTH